MQEFAPLGATYAFNYGNEGGVSAGPPDSRIAPRQELIISPRAVREKRLSARHVNHGAQAADLWPSNNIWHKKTVPDGSTTRRRIFFLILDKEAGPWCTRHSLCKAMCQISFRCLNTGGASILRSVHNVLCNGFRWSCPIWSRPLKEVVPVMEMSHAWF